jgi:hypothetical protein
MEKLALLYDSLEAEGFDIVHVDFEESKIPIAENAQTVLRVLNWIKGQNPVNPTIVVGASMGGLISRTALLKLEESNCCLNVAAYGTFDSPHDGAFIPIGLQAAAKRFSELIPMVASVSDAWNKTLNSIAARQMLIEHYDSTAYLDRIQFEQFISKGQPTTIRTFAISNGSDLALSTSMQDAGKRYINYGNQRAVVVRHHLGSSLDSVQFNFTGVTSNVKTVGGRSEAHAGATTYLFEGSPWMNVWRYKKMDWISQRGARRARWAFEAGQQYSFIPSSYVDAFILGIQRGTNKKLSRVYSKAQSAGVKAHESNYTFSLDEAPGSLTNTPEGFANFLVSVYSPTHSFIPTFSSLDIGANQNGTAVRGNLELIPFDTYYAPGLLSDQALGNQMHIFTNEEVIRFCLKNLKSIHRKIEPQGALVQDFNISKSSNSWSGYPSELGGLIVESTATLKVAHDGVIGRASSNQWADSQQNIRVFVSPSCHGETLLVRGALFLGQNNQRKADLVIRSGGTLRLAAGGILKIGEGSSLVVEEGASLVLEPGAKVHWSDGTIILHGIIEMEGGADFIPSGKGTIVVDNGGSISALQGGLIALEECEVELLSTLQVSASVSQFSLDKSEVKLYNQIHLILSCPVQLWNSSFSQIGAKQWSGVQLNGVSADLQHVRFEYGWPALSIGASTSWELQNAQFTDAIVGVQSKKEPLSFYSNSFYSCRTGADLEGVDLKMNQCSFQSCEFGAILHDLSGTATIEKSQFYGNYGTAVMVDAVNCRMKCNTFYNNNTGASVSGAHLNLGNNAGNTFSQNQTGLYIDDVMGLQLNQGHNVFSSNTRFDIEGSFHPNASIPYNGTTYALPSNYNSFSSFSSTSLWQGRHSVYLNYNPNLTVNSLLCPSKDPKKSQVEQAFEREEAAPTLYPNPTKGTPGQFTFEVLQEDAELLVVSASGQIVLRKSVFSGMESTEIPVPNASGVYTIQLNNSQIHYRLKWVVQ